MILWSRELKSIKSMHALPNMNSLLLAAKLRLRQCHKVV